MPKGTPFNGVMLKVSYAQQQIDRRRKQLKVRNNTCMVYVQQENHWSTATASGFADLWTNQRAPSGNLDQTDQCGSPGAESTSYHHQHLQSRKQPIHTNAAKTYYFASCGYTHTHTHTHTYPALLLFITFISHGTSHTNTPTIPHFCLKHLLHLLNWHHSEYLKRYMQMNIFCITQKPNLHNSDKKCKYGIDVMCCVVRNAQALRGKDLCLSAGYWHKAHTLQHQRMSEEG